MVKHHGRFQPSVSVLPGGTALSLIFPGAGARMRMLDKVWERNPLTQKVRGI